MIDKAVCLTMTPNPPIVGQLKNYLNVEQFIVGKDIIDEPVQAERPQIWNYWRSIQEIIKIAKNQNVSNLLFLEEDATLVNTSDFDSKFHYFCSINNQLRQTTLPWDLFFLGSNCVNGRITHTPYNDIIIPTYTLDHHAVIYNKSSFDLILSLQPNPVATYDGKIADLQSKGLLNVCAFHHSIITQLPGWSKNEKRFVDRSINHNIY